MNEMMVKTNDKALFASLFALVFVLTASSCVVVPVLGIIVVVILLAILIVAAE